MICGLLCDVFYQLNGYLSEKGGRIMSFAPVRGIEVFGGRVVLGLAGGPQKGVREGWG